MAIAHSTWREYPFETGRTYKTNGSFDAFPSTCFVAGSTYILLDAGYSHYDSCSVFQFQEIGSSRELSRWWPDDHGVSECLECFEQVV